MTDTPLLELRGISKSFGSVQALTEVDFDVRHGEAGDMSHAEIHNGYGTLHARACADGMRKLRPSKRSLVLSRSGFA